ncbi:hypothetical protein KUQ09_001260 [Salmonella enterica]|nr:hypothetical protein [Salmonella enterica]
MRKIRWRWVRELATISRGTFKHNVLQEEDGVQGKCMIIGGLRMVMNKMNGDPYLTYVDGKHSSWG